MSFNTWHTYGYGVNVSEINCDSVERIQALLQLAPELKQAIEEWLEDREIETPSVEDYFEYDEDYNLGLASIMKGIILEKEGIELTACDDFDNNIYILYEPRYPWHTVGKEKKLTEKKIKEILLKYFSIITDDTIEVDYFNPENGG